MAEDDARRNLFDTTVAASELFEHIQFHKFKAQKIISPLCLLLLLFFFRNKLIYLYKTEK